MKKYHSLFAYLLLLFCVFLFPTNVFALSIPSSSAVFAEDNNLHILQKGEYAVVLSGENMDGPLDKTMVVTLKEGDTFPIKVPSGAFSFSIVEYEEGVTNYFPQNNPSVQIRNIGDFTGYDKTGIVDTAIERNLKNNEEVSVIVKLNVAEKNFYQKGDILSKINKKKNDFKKAKDSIVGDIVKINSNNKKSLKFKIDKELQVVNSVSLKVDKEMLEELKKNPNVSKINLDRKVKTLLDTSLDDLNVQHAWSMLDANSNLITGTGVRIAIIDTGVDYNHADLGGCLGVNCKVIGGYDFINNDNDPMDDNGHGTHVAATAAGNGLLKGVAPDAKILAYKVLGSDGSGSFSGIISAIQRTIDPNNDGNSNDHVDVASMSLGADCSSYNSSCGPDDDMSLAVDSASLAGVIFTIAAGNSGREGITVATPGTARSAITVAASYKTSNNPTYPIADFSSRGPVIINNVDLHKPDITAPGVSICAARWGNSFEGAPTCFDNNHMRISGTSMATPHIAGVAALIKQAHPNFTPAQAKELIKDTATSLGLSIPYNEQGSGIANLESIIPSNLFVVSVPSQWSIQTNPTQKLSTHTQSFSVSSSVPSITSASIVPSTLPNGVTLNLDKQTLSFGNDGLSTDSFLATLTVDNDIAMAGSYNINIVFKDGNEDKGAIVVPMTITPTITSNINDIIDYGNNSPSGSTWVSDSNPVIFTNKRTDIPQTINFSSSSFINGISYQFSPTSLTIQPNSSQTIQTNFTVDNSQVANGVYYGKLKADNSVISLSINTKFTKYYSFTFSPSNSSDFSETTIITLTKTTYPSENLFYNLYNTGPVTMYTNLEGPYDASILMQKYSDKSIYYVGLDNIFSGSYTVGRSDANRIVGVNPVNFDGNSDSTIVMDKHLSVVNTTGYGRKYVSFYGWGGNFYINGSISSKFDIHLLFTTNNGATQNNYILGGKVNGLSSGNVIFTNTAQDLEEFTIKPFLNVPDNTNIFSGYISLCFIPGYCYSLYNNTKLITPFTKKIYVKSDLNMPDLAFKFSTSGDDCIFSDQCAFQFTTPRVYPTTKKQMHTFSNTYIPQNIINGEISAGLGPVGWFMKFENTTSQIKAINVPFVDSFPVLRQGYEKQSFPDIPYTIKQSGVTVNSGDIVGESAEQYASQNFILQNLSSGNYLFNALFPYHILGQTMSGEVEESFNTSLSDKNPPYLNRISYYIDGVKNQVYNRNYTNRIELEFNANGGNIGSVNLSYSTDGNTFTPITMNSPVGGVYSATLPTLSNTSGVLSLRFKATDDSNNYFQNTIQIPIIDEIMNFDNTPPVVSITAPANNENVSGSVTISANATDNINIGRVVFYVDGVFVNYDTTFPYSVSWNSLSSPNGIHLLTAKAYDTSNNVATSSQISVTVGNINTVPSLSTLSVDSVSSTGVSLNGNILSTGGNNSTIRGFNYGITSSYGTTTIENGSFSEGLFTKSIGSLNCGTTYHYRSYATNSLGTGYGDDDIFTTYDCPISLPTLMTMAVSSKTASTVTLNGNILSTGGNAPTVRGYEYGTDTSYGTTTTETGQFPVGQFSSNITSLLPSTTYHYRSYATNSLGTGYGADQSFTTDQAVIPSVSTQAVGSFSSVFAYFNGTITSVGSHTLTSKGFEYGTDTNYGQVYSEVILPYYGGVGSFNKRIINLTCETTYHYRAFAASAIGAGYGDDQSFTTEQCLPSMTTEGATFITKKGAVLSGTAIGRGSEIFRVGFNYSTTPSVYTSSRGLSVGFGPMNLNPTPYSVGPFIDLTPSTTYYYRAYGENNSGTSYGVEKSFTTLANDIPISNPAILNVVAPTIGATPSSSVYSSYEYTATISWDGNPSTFAAETVYTATINIVPKIGYTLTGVTQNFFTVDGATVTNSADSGVVTVVFPTTGTLTGPSTIGGIVNISGVAKYGETLTADISGLTYSPNISTDVPAYQWMRSGSQISSATSNIYTLIEEDIGSIITVKITADGVHATGEVTSSATDAISKLDGPSAPNAPVLISKTYDTIILAANNLNEFSNNNGASWQSSETFTGLNSSTQYVFITRVKSTSISNASTASVGTSVITDSLTVPGKVADLTASAVSVSQINLSWTAPSSNGGSTITGYKIERATPIGGIMTTLAASNANTTYNNIGLTASTGYSYQVSAINDVGTGLASDISSATTSTVITGGGSSGGGGGPSITKPTVYSITPILITGIAATLNGNISATGGASITVRGFNYGTTTSYGKNTIENGTFGTGTFSTNISSLTCGTIYHFQSYATNSVGTSYGPDQTFSTLACGVIPPVNPEVKTVPNTNQTNIILDILKISRSLKLGMTGEDVKTLQKYLNTHGYVIATSGNGSSGNESTYFGQKTKDAVIKFQKANGLVADGAVGKKTRELMAKLDNINIPHVEPILNILPSVPVVNNPIISNTNIIGSQSLKLGMTGEDVKTLQKYLNTHGYVIATSGNGSLGNESTYFGQKTKDAVIKFQKANGLVADGAVGKKTRELMANPDIKNSVIENKITPPVKEIVKPVVKPVVNTLPKVEVPTTNKYLNKTLKQGMTDSDVIKLQKLLNNFGYTVSKTGIGSPGSEGSVFDSLTTKAVKDFQIDNELKTDGIVGGETRNLMNAMWEKSH